MASLMLPRRVFLFGLAAMFAAPAIVRIENIMPDDLRHRILRAD